MNQNFTTETITAQDSTTNQGIYNEYRTFGSIPLTMTQEEYYGTDFYYLTNKLLRDYINAFGQVYNLTRKYSVSIVDDEGKVLGVHNLTCNVTPDVFLFDNPDIRKDENTGGYLFAK